MPKRRHVPCAVCKKRRGTRGGFTTYSPRCDQCADRIAANIRGLQASRAAVKDAYEAGLLEDTESVVQSPDARVQDSSV